MLQGHWKSMAMGLRGLATSTAPKMKAAMAELHADMGGGRQGQRRWVKGEFVPVYIVVGLVALQMTIGLHTAKQQLMHAPNVSVRKRRRETLPEVAEPEHVLNEAEEFLKKSFLRRVAHVQDPEHNYVVKDPTRADAFAQAQTARLHHAETLKSVGVDPSLPPVDHHK